MPSFMTDSGYAWSGTWSAKTPASSRNIGPPSPSANPGRILRSFPGVTTRRWHVKFAQIRMLGRALPVALGLLATVRLSAETPAPREPEAKPLEVTYFFLPG
jgi:hypothetical protein